MNVDPNNSRPGDGDSDTDELLPLIYDELRQLAESYLRQERPNHTLQPTALVHEAYLRLAELDRMKWRDRTHFQIAASGTIRRVLVDHARKRNAIKREGSHQRITLSDTNLPLTRNPVDMLALNEALERLADLDDRKARVVELRFFGGLTVEKTAAALGVGTTTVEDDWALARAWLQNELTEDRQR